MFWRITGLSTTSPVDSILDKDNYTLEELLDEDEIIQEYKALNSRLTNFLRGKTQVEQLLRYIIEEGHGETENTHTFKFPFIACEIITCDVDIVLKTLVEDEELMDLLFSFLKPDHSRSTSLAGYFSKVVSCLIIRKTIPLMKYVQAHQEIFEQLVDLIGITSIMEVLIRLIGADEHIYSNYMDSMQWLENTNILEMIVDKFSSSDSPEVHANVAETLSAITRCAPPVLAAKIFSPSFVGRLFHHALEDSRPKSVLVYSLTVCISLLDPKRLASASYHSFNMARRSLVTASPETVEGMLESLGHLVKLLDTSSTTTSLTTYGSLQPPLGNLRLKIVEFISVLLTIGNENAEKELVHLGVIQRILDLFFEYPFNNFLHHHVEAIILSCLESKGMFLVQHLFEDCDIIGKILGAEKSSILSTEASKPTMPADGKIPPRIGNIGHLTRISNKLAQLADNSATKIYLQENNEWVDWYTNVLLKRNSMENIYQWVCGRPTVLDDRNRDSDDDDFKSRAFDIATFLHDAYNNDDIEEAHRSLEQDDEEIYFDDSAEVIISSLNLGDDRESISVITNPNWLAFEDDQVFNTRPSRSFDSSSPSLDDTDEVVVCENDGVSDAAPSSQLPRLDGDAVEPENLMSGDFPVENGLVETENDSGQSLSTSEFEKPPEWVEWRETSDSGDFCDSEPTLVDSNGECGEEKNHVILEAATDHVTKCLSPPATAEDNSVEETVVT